MNQRTRSWRSQTRTQRWTSGRVRPVGEGGKAAVVRGGTLEDQEAIGEHGEGEMTMEAVPASPLIVVQPALALGVFVELLDRPAGMGQFDQPFERGLGRQVAGVAILIAVAAGDASAIEEPVCAPGAQPAALGAAHVRPHVLLR